MMGLLVERTRVKKSSVLFSPLQALTGVLLALMILAPTAVLGGDYSSTFFIFASSDRQERHFADLAVTYNAPDSVTTGDLLGVDVSITYENNNNATFPWIEIYNVTASLHNSPKGADLAFEIDSSRVRATPGQQYAHKFNIRAPQKLGQYILILAWLTHNPQASAYGYHIDEGIFSWDVGAKRLLDVGTYGDPPTVVVSALTTAAATTTSTSPTSQPTSTAQIVTTGTSSSPEAQPLSLGQNTFFIGAAIGIVLVVLLLLSL